MMLLMHLGKLSLFIIGVADSKTDEITVGTACKNNACKKVNSKVTNTWVCSMFEFWRPPSAIEMRSLE